MRDLITIDLGPELIEHFLNDSFWEKSDGSWPEVQKADQQEIERLNVAELPCEPEELIIEICNHPNVTDADHYHFQGCCHVITFKWNDPRDGELYYPGKHYKFDIWTYGPVNNYEATRWTDQPWSG